jgi:hypothetical protein
LFARPFHLEHEFERGLMLEGPLVVRVPEAHLDEAHVEAGALGDLNGGRHESHDLGNWRRVRDSNPGVQHGGSATC